MKTLEKSHTVLRRQFREKHRRYAIVEAAVKDTCFFTFAHDGRRLVLVLNPDHPFYRDIYKPLVEGDAPRDRQLRAKLELLLLAAARSEAGAKGKHRDLGRYRLDWSNTFATYLNEK